MVNTSDINHMYDMAHSIVYGSTALLTQEAIIEAYLHHTTRSCNGAQLIIGEIARMVAQGASRRVTAYDGGAAGLNSLIEGALGCM